MMLADELYARWAKGRYYIDLFEKSVDKISRADSLFSDEESRSVFRGILQAYADTSGSAYKFLQSVASFDPDESYAHFVANDGYEVRGPHNPYFLNDIFSFEEEVVFLDGGAFIGDTLGLAQEFFGDKLAFYHAFEPNEQHFKKLEEASTRIAAPGVLLRKGLDDHNGSTAFLMSGAGSRIDSQGDVRIETVSAKDYLRNVSELPTFIKLDIEGAEQRVLCSMRDFIAANGPDLAISAYHALDDLWEIPLAIHGILPDYRIYMRHQSNYFTETICYATL